MHKNRLVKILIIVFVFGFVLMEGCPFKNIFGIQCPTCGVTRAIISFIHLDFYEYCLYNIMAIPICIACFLIIFKNNNDLYLKVAYGLLIINFIYYVIRIFVFHNYI